MHPPGGVLSAKPLAVPPSLRLLFRLNHLGTAGLQPPGTLLLTPGSLDVARTRQNAASWRGSRLQKDRAGLTSGLPLVCGSRWPRSVPGACVLVEITETEQFLASCRMGPAAPNFQLPRCDGDISIKVSSCTWDFNSSCHCPPSLAAASHFSAAPSTAVLQPPMPGTANKHGGLDAVPRLCVNSPR